MERNIEGVKKALIYPPALYDNYSTESAAVDGNDFDEAEFTLYVGDTDIDVDFKVQESDASGSGFADITDAAITELGDSDDNKFVVINVNLVPGSRKRYLRRRTRPASRRPRPARRGRPARSRPRRARRKW